jgi:hypothetical protein
MTSEYYRVWIRRGRLINDDPQKRCYNGCYFASHIEWDAWEHWEDYPSLDQAERARRQFSREDQELRISDEVPDDK